MTAAATLHQCFDTLADVSDGVGEDLGEVLAVAKLTASDACRDEHQPDCGCVTPPQPDAEIPAFLLRLAGEQEAR